MAGFFESPEPPERPEPRAYRTPRWLGPPQGELPAAVPFERVLAQTDAVAVCVARVCAYTTGFEFDVIGMTAPGADFADPLLYEHQRQVARGRRDLPPEVLRFGLRFDDGTKVTTTSGREPPRRGEDLAGPVLSIRGGGGGGGRWAATMWVWPLPPPGPVRFVCEWPAQGIALVHVEVDGQAILDASRRASVVFSDEQLPARPVS